MGEVLRSHPELFTKSLKLTKTLPKKSNLCDDKADEIDIESSACYAHGTRAYVRKIGKLTSTTSGSATKESTERDIFIMSNFAFLKEHISRVMTCRIAQDQHGATTDLPGANTVVIRTVSDYPGLKNPPGRSRMTTQLNSLKLPRWCPGPSRTIQDHPGLSRTAPDKPGPNADPTRI